MGTRTTSTETIRKMWELCGGKGNRGEYEGGPRLELKEDDVVMEVSVEVD